MYTNPVTLVHNIYLMRGGCTDEVLSSTTVCYSMVRGFYTMFHNELVCQNLLINYRALLQGITEDDDSLKRFVPNSPTSFSLYYISSM